MLRKLIDQQQEAERIQNKLMEVYQYPKTEYAEGFVNACNAVLKMLDSLPPADAIPCNFCRFTPPSLEDGKPCGVCPAERREA